MRIAPTFAEARRDRAGVVGVVPTMGFLHEGHLSLIEAARRDCGTVLVTLYVNAMQFGDESDLAAYPRDLERDAELASAAGADVLFAPSETAMFREPPLTTVHVAGVGDAMEGLHRPGHFTGVATVVAKLFGGLRPDRAYFGRKDAQQLALITRMTADLSLPIDIVPCPTVREQDGLALSSRNTRLGPIEREDALVLSRGLMAAADAVEAGEREGTVLEALVTDEVRRRPSVTLEYASLAAQDSAQRVAALDRPAFLATAVRVGDARLIDCVHLDAKDDGFAADRGRRLDSPSVLYEEA